MSGKVCRLNLYADILPWLILLQRGLQRVLLLPNTPQHLHNGHPLVFEKGYIQLPDSPPWMMLDAVGTPPLSIKSKRDNL